MRLNITYVKSKMKYSYNELTCHRILNTPKAMNTSCAFPMHKKQIDSLSCILVCNAIWPTGLEVKCQGVQPGTFNSQTSSFANYSKASVCC